jgi:membrane associated rhomboid family serine protease
MLIVPLHRRPTAATLPWITIALVLANAFVYLFLQSGDHAALQRAAGYYERSGLAAIELPRFIAHLDGSGRAQWAAALKAMPAAQRAENALQMMAAERVFESSLRAGEVIGAHDPQHAQWSENRRRLDALLGEQFTPRWMLPNEGSRPVQWLSAAFLHGDLGHLIGNMVFLVLLGLLVEGALGPMLFLTVYLIAAVGSSVVSILVNAGEPGGSLGASGAIAGLMGAYCVLWGLRKVRVFYWLFVVFDYARVPALVLLPLWLGWELYNWRFNDGVGVAFEAHAGGLLVGALAAFGVRALRWERSEFLDHEQRGDSIEALRAELRTALGRLEFARARELSSALIAQAPADWQARELHFRAWRSAPEDPAFHDSARRLLLDPVRGGRSATEHVALFDDYLTATRRRPKLSGSELLLLARRWCAAQQFEPAERLLSMMSQRQPALPGLPEAWFDLLLAARERAVDGIAARAAMAIERHWPQSAQNAKLQAQRKT